MMAIEAAYCKLDAAKVEYSKLMKEAKQKAKTSETGMRTRLLKAKRRQENQRIRPVNRPLMSLPMQLR